MIWRKLRASPLGGFSAYLAVLVCAGCGDEGPVPVCKNCENWTQITREIGRFPAIHPTSPEFVVFSTVDKDVLARDANRDSDEDIWLQWILGAAQPSENSVLFQLTGDGTEDSTSTLAAPVGDNFGDNFAPRWSPDGTQIAFTHTDQAGRLEIWRMSVTAFPTGDQEPILTAPERVVRDGRDPAWVSDDLLMFTRADKLHYVSVPSGPGPPSSAAVQITFDPPAYATTDDWIDRHPDFPTDGTLSRIGVFDSRGRRSAASLFIEAFEIDREITPPDTFETDAHILFQAPGGGPSYPIFEGADTLRTPVLLRSLPVDGGGNFLVGVRRDFRFVADSTVDFYCDTTLTRTVNLQPGDVDSIVFYFERARGSLEVTSDISNTSVFFTRADGEVFTPPGSDTEVRQPGNVLAYDCLFSFEIDLATGVVNPDSLEPFIVTGTRGSLTHVDTVAVAPPGTPLPAWSARVPLRLFPSVSLFGQFDFSDSPSVAPRVEITVNVAGTSERLNRVFTTLGDTTFSVAGVPRGSYDVLFSAAGYQPVTIQSLAVTFPGDVDLGTILFAAATGQAIRPSIAAGAETLRPEEPRAGVVSYHRLAAKALASRGASLSDLLRAESSALWTVDISNLGAPSFRKVLADTLGGIIQNPAVSPDFGNGVRFVAFVSDDSGEWELYVLRLTTLGSGQWAADGDPIMVDTPGTLDNLSCTRNVFYPRWHPASRLGELILQVALSECPDNSFSELELDDDPWALGEFRIWEVVLALR